MNLIVEHPQFFTATIFYWKKLLAPNKYKDIIVKSLKFLVSDNRVIIYGFVIMPNHIHIIWQMREGIIQSNVQRDFLKYTSQQIKFDLQANHPQVLEHFKVDVKDRKYQIWENRPLSIPIWTPQVLEQKLNYIHNNPLQEKWKLSDSPKTIITQVQHFIN